MEFVILGAGALGCVYGGLLASAGHDVKLVAHGPTYLALRNRGLRLKLPVGTISPKVNVFDNPRQVDSSDVVLVTVKARDTETVLLQSQHLAKRSLFISLQNSAMKDELLVKHVGASSVIGGVTTLGATIVEPGITEFTVMGNTWLGELPKGLSERVENLAKVFNDAKIKTTPAENITAIKSAKLVQFCASAGVSSLTRLKQYQILQDKLLARIIIEVIKEGANVMKSRGVTIDDHEGLMPIKRIMSLPEDELIREFAERGKVKSREESQVIVSMLWDVLHGRPLEVEETLGYLVSEATKYGVAVPTLKTIYSLVRGLNTGVQPSVKSTF